MIYGSLFSGIGGIDLGLDRAGMRCAWQVEKDEFCRRVLEKHWPDVPRFEDVKEFGRNSIDGTVDLVTGGFPCQPHSTAGKRRGAADDRDLWPEYRRIVEEFQPRWVLAENVLGIRTTILDKVLSDLEGLDYTARALIVPACAFDAPHIRKRIFIVAYAQGARTRGLSVRQGRPQQTSVDINGNGKNVENTECDCHRPKNFSDKIAGKDGKRSSSRVSEPSRWAVEPAVCRVADGIPRQMDRLRALGNAVVPQVAEWIGQCIMSADIAQEMEATK